MCRGKVIGHPREGLQMVASAVDHCRCGADDSCLIRLLGEVEPLPIFQIMLVRKIKIARNPQITAPLQMRETARCAASPLRPTKAC